MRPAAPNLPARATTSVSVPQRPLLRLPRTHLATARIDRTRSRELSEVIGRRGDRPGDRLGTVERLAPRASACHDQRLSAYFVVNCTIEYMAILNDYMQSVRPSLGVVPIKVLAADNESETVEGTPAGGRTVLLEFASKDDFHSWYNSPEYQGVIAKRFAATEGFGVLVNGL